MRHLAYGFEVTEATTLFVSPPFVLSAVNLSRGIMAGFSAGLVKYLKQNHDDNRCIFSQIVDQMPTFLTKTCQINEDMLCVLQASERIVR